MAESRLIGGYLAELSAQLPEAIVAELADGLDQTHRHYLGQGLGPGAAAAAAVAEFGEPQVIVTAFTRASPARRAGRTLLAAGPVVGACWGTALIVNRAWAWPVPAAARLVLGVALTAAIGLLATAAFSGHYRAAAAGCIGMTAIDAALLGATLAAPPVIWPIIVAVAASAARITFAARTLRLVLLTG